MSAFEQLKKAAAKQATSGTPPKRLFVEVKGIDDTNPQNKVLVGVDALTGEQVRVTLRPPKQVGDYAPLTIHDLQVGKGQARPLDFSNPEHPPYVTFRGCFENPNGVSAGFVDVLTRGGQDKFNALARPANVSVFFPRDERSKGSAHAYVLATENTKLAPTEQDMLNTLGEIFSQGDESGRPFAYVRAHDGGERIAIKVEMKQGLNEPRPEAAVVVNEFLQSESGQLITQLVRDGKLAIDTTTAGRQTGVEVIPGYRIPAGKGTRTDWFTKRLSRLVALASSYAIKTPEGIQDGYRNTVMSYSPSSHAENPMPFFSYVENFPQDKLTRIEDIATPVFESGEFYEPSEEQRRETYSHFAALAGLDDGANQAQQAAQQQPQNGYQQQPQQPQAGYQQQPAPAAQQGWGQQAQPQGQPQQQPVQHAAPTAQQGWGQQAQPQGQPQQQPAQAAQPGFAQQAQPQQPAPQAEPAQNAWQAPGATLSV